MMGKKLLALLTTGTLLSLGMALDACTQEEPGASSQPPSAIVPPDPGSTPVAKPISDPVAALGQLLFWDPILSGDKDVACATCHHPDNAYTDGLDLSLGPNATGYSQNRFFRNPNDVPLTKRNTPTILNTAYNGMDANGNYVAATAPMFWDSRTQSLESQVSGPLLTFEEMRGHAYSETVALDSLVARLTANAEYRQLFQAAFGSSQAISATTISQAIAAFERTLLAMDAPFDRYQKGNKAALSDQQLQGMELFKSAGCSICHSGPMFSDFQLHVLAVPENSKRVDTDAGADGSYGFRTPSLRNVKLTAPYMHNGIFEDLKQVVQFYDQIGKQVSQNPNVAGHQIDRQVRRIALRDFEQEQLIAFLNALTDANFDRTIPIRVPSGLKPGGNLRR